MRHHEIFDHLREDGPDLGLDVYGGNPYSPVWVCGLEFGGGRNILSDFVRRAAYGVDLALEAPLFNHTPDEYEYVSLEGLLVAALTDADFRARLGASSQTSERLELLRAYAPTHRLFACGGFGFQMNSGVLSLASHDSLSGATMALGPTKTVALADYLAPLSLEAYRARATAIFKRHVRARLERYRPRLVICTGRGGEGIFRSLFCEDAKAAPLMRHADKHSPRTRFELYRGVEYENSPPCLVVHCHFLSDRRPGTPGYAEMVELADAIRSLEPLSWLDSLPRPEPAFVDERAKAMAERIDRLLYSPTFDRQAFVRRDDVRACTNALGGREAFKAGLARVRPSDEGERFAALEPTTGEAFMALLAYALEAPERRREVWRALTQRMAQHAGDVFLKALEQDAADGSLA